MGVLNVTPDSFSDGGQFFSADAAIARAFEMEQAGADLIDVGAESTRPGATGISAEEELQRVLPVLKAICGRLRIPVSIDTSKARVADEAAMAGAEIVNDVTAFRGDPAMAATVQRRKMAAILMHMRGKPRTMQKEPFARDAIHDVTSGLKRAIQLGLRAGIGASRIAVDPGLGFGKSYEQSLTWIGALPELAKLGLPIVVGPSRKSFIGKAQGGSPENDRLWGTAAAVTAAILGGTHIVRVHDVKEMVKVVRVADAIRNRGRLASGKLSA